MSALHARLRKLEQARTGTPTRFPLSRALQLIEACRRRPGMTMEDVAAQDRADCIAALDESDAACGSTFTEGLAHELQAIRRRAGRRILEGSQ